MHVTPTVISQIDLEYLKTLLQGNPETPDFPGQHRQFRNNARVSRTIHEIPGFPGV